MKIVVMIGIPGSGKSTWVKDFMKDTKEDYYVVSKDSLREMLYPVKYTYDKELEKVVKCLQQNIVIDMGIKDRNTVIDDTNINANKRLMMFNNLIHWGVNIEQVTYIELEGEVDSCLKRRMTNPKSQSESIWERVIKDMYKSKQSVSKDELDFFTDMKIKFNHNKISVG